MRRFLVALVAVWLLALGALTAQRPTPLAARLDAALKAAGVPILGVSIGDPANKATWRVQPSSMQSAAQPTIDAFNVNDPSYEQAELDAQVKAMLDSERLTSAVVWTVLKQMFPGDLDAQTKIKFGPARARIIDAFKAQPWK